MAVETYFIVGIRTADGLLSTEEIRMSDMADDGSDWTTIVYDPALLGNSAAEKIKAGFEVAIWGEIEYIDVRLRLPMGAFTPLNVASNAQQKAFVRLVDDVTGEEEHFHIPAPDMALYSVDASQRFGAAFLGAANLIGMIAAMRSKAGNTVSATYAQLQGRKRGPRLT